MFSISRLNQDPRALEELLQPETALERRLFEVPVFREGMLWGEPRFGHPEGKVALHVREVLDNIDLIKELPEQERERLRLVALSHDTFKYQEDRSRPRDWSKHHAMLAVRFMQEFTNDRHVLDLIETHDDAFYAWLASRNEQFLIENPHKSLDRLFERIGYCRQLYYLFFKCDTQTGDKTQASLKWFEKNAVGIELVRIREEDEPPNKH